jgi:hypothetical protein
MIVAVGGQARKTGKSAVVAGIIAALPEFEWTAIKITRHNHGEGWGVFEEAGPGDTDTGRFLAAGARRAFYISGPESEFEQVAGEVRRIAEASRHVIIESNSIGRYLRPDLELLVLDAQRSDAKCSAAEVLARAAAVIVRGPAPSEIPAGVKCFVVDPPQYVTAAVADFVRARLSS